MVAAIREIKHNEEASRVLGLITEERKNSQKNINIASTYTSWKKGGIGRRKHDRSTMEKLKNGDAPSLVSNVEVMQLLRDRIGARNAKKDESTENRRGPFQNRDWIEQTVLTHLESSPAGETSIDEIPKLASQLRRNPPDKKNENRGTNMTSQENFDRSLEGYGLTRGEALQIINHMPTTLVELHLIIENIEDRPHLDDEGTQAELLDLIASFRKDAID